MNPVKLVQNGFVQNGWMDKPVTHSLRDFTAVENGYSELTFFHAVGICGSDTLGASSFLAVRRRDPARDHLKPACPQGLPTDIAVCDEPCLRGCPGLEAIMGEPAPNDASKSIRVELDDELCANSTPGVGSKIASPPSPRPCAGCCRARL